MVLQHWCECQCSDVEHKPEMVALNGNGTLVRLYFSHHWCGISLIQNIHNLHGKFSVHVFYGKYRMQFSKGWHSLVLRPNPIWMSQFSDWYLASSQLISMRFFSLSFQHYQMPMVHWNNTQRDSILSIDWTLISCSVGWFVFKSHVQ